MLNRELISLGMGGLSTLLSAKGDFDRAGAYDTQAESLDMQAGAIQRRADRLMAANSITSAQYRQNANEAIGAGQRVAMLKEQEGIQAISRALAVAAASGAGVTNRTVHDLMNKLAARSQYNEDVARYEVLDTARLLRAKADFTDYESKLTQADAADAAAASRQAANAARETGDTARGGAVSNLLSRAGGLFDKYYPKGSGSTVPDTPNVSDIPFDQFWLAGT